MPRCLGSDKALNFDLGANNCGSADSSRPSVLIFHNFSVNVRQRIEEKSAMRPKVDMMKSRCRGVEGIESGKLLSGCKECSTILAHHTSQIALKGRNTDVICHREAV